MNSNYDVTTGERGSDPALPALPMDPSGEADAQQPASKPAKPRRADRVASALWSFVLPFLLMSFTFMVLVYGLTFLLSHWRVMDAHAEAEAIYTKRKAELKAEAEHADARLDVLDKRVHLASLGFREVARKVMPTVVNIHTYREPTKRDLELVEARRLRLTYDPENDRQYVQQGVGSGVIYKPGVILTNHHVVRDAQRLRINFASGRSIGVDLSRSASDSRTDLAVIRLPEDAPAAVREEAKHNAVFADSDKDVEIGDWTLAMGSPRDLRHTVTHGIVSAKGRLLSLEDLDLVELIQTDAAINQGNSGGPLFDQLGRVIGINVAISTDNGGNQGLGFAIPSNNAKRIAEMLLAKGEVPRGYLGIAMGELPGEEIKSQKIENGAVVVTEVVKDQPAQKAGLKVGDIILRVNKAPLSRWKTVRHFRQVVVDVEPGQVVTLDVLRNGEPRQIAVTAGKRPKDLR